MTSSLASFVPSRLADRFGNVSNAAMKMPSPDTSVKPSRRRRSRWLAVLTAFAALAWSLPRPLFQEVVIESDSDTPRGRLAFRTAERLDELSGKGTLADETELSGPCFAEDGQTLYFSRSRPGQRADILRSTFTDERWSKPERVRELNSVDDDRRLTLSADGRVAALASNRSGGHGGFDIYEVTQSDDRWPRPHNAGAAINTDAEEFDPALTPDGLTLYFVRAVPGTSADVFVTRRDSLDSAWSEPEPVAAINSSDHHERSPAVSPDGQWLLFASNRGDRPGESAPFGLFRAPILNGQVATPERLRDGLASDADDVDAAFASDGQSLVFVSKREGTKQIYLSRGDFVVTRLTISAAHLDRFESGKWWLPVLAALLLILTWRWSRRAVPVAVAQAEKSSTITVVTPPRRSEPPKNPLESWTVTPADQDSTPVPVVNPLKVPKTTEPTTAGQPVSAATVVSPPRRSRWAALAIVATAAAMLVVLRIDPSDQTTTNAPTAISELWVELLQFSDVASPRNAELPKLDRTSTVRKDAPQPSAPPSNIVALRPGARWPADRVLVRQPSELNRAGEVDPRLLSLSKAPVVARRPSATALARPTERPGEELKLTVAAITAEKPNGLAPTVTTKQTFDPRSTERTAVLSAVPNQATLRAPSARLDPLVPSSPAMISDSRRDALVRSGAVTRKMLSLGLAEPEVLIATSTASVTTEPLLPVRVVNVSRMESVPVTQPTPLSSKLPLDRRALLTSSQDQYSATIDQATRPTSRTEGSRLPIKLSAAPKVMTLTEEVIAPTPAVPSVEANVVSPSATLSRGETHGPQLSLPPIGPATMREGISALRIPSRIEASELAILTAKIAPAVFARRETFVPTTATISAVDSAGGMGTAAPAILLTSASMLVELLASAPMPALPRAESGGPATSDTPQLPSKALPWVVQGWMWTLPTATEPNSVPAKQSLPRRIRERVPAELVETIPTTP